MPTPVILPRQGQSVENCIITKWHKAKGDEVKSGDLLFSYETDKAAFDAEAVDSGILLDIFFDDGSEVPVLTNIGVIGNPGEDYEDLIPEELKGKHARARENIEIETTGQMVSTGTATAKETALPEMPAIENDTKHSIEPADTHIRVSPLARRIAGENNIDITHIKGSGPQGRIIERDIRAVLQSSESEKQRSGILTTAPGQRKKDFPALPSEEPTVFGKEEFSDIKLSNVRKIISEKMAASLHTAAQLTHHLSADARQLLSFRKNIKENAGKPGFVDITINDMVCYATVQALKKHKEINAHFLGVSIRTFYNVHLGFAVDTDRGLMVPVLKNASDLNLPGLAVRMKSLAAGCKQGNIDPGLLASEAASFTVTNLGAFGIEMFTPVLNLPQTGILGINTISYKPADLGNGTIGFIPVIGLSLTYDHRAIDGAPASRFLKEVKYQVENFLPNL